MRKNRLLSRRRFLKRAATAAGAVAALPAIVPSRVLGVDAPSNTIVMGTIGVGGRGRYDMGAFMGNGDVRMVAVCDVQAGRRKGAKGTVDRKYRNSDCKAYIDPRDLLARRDIDAVLIATGDNNHSGVAILAARAGKDIYCEKPMSITIAESRAVADTMRRFARVYQCGTQRRSLGNFVFAINLARSGKLGKLQTLHAEKAAARSGVRFTVLPAQPEPPREVMDWDMWLGPAPWRPYNARYYTRGFWASHGDFSGGSITEWGSHTVDLCQWANQADGTAPVQYEPIGAERGEGAKRVVHARYANGVKLVMRAHDAEGWLGLGSCQVRFEGEEGWVETGDSGKIALYPETLRAQRTIAVDVEISAVSHVRNFFDCVKSRAQLACSADIARWSHVAGHAAAIAWMLDRKVVFDPAKEAFIGDDEANRMRTRAMREPWHM